MLPLKFDTLDYHHAYDEWGANCGPGAIAAVLGLSLKDLRPSMGDFEKKRYTNPKLMVEILNRLNVSFTVNRKKPVAWPLYGLARIQWEGPWTLLAREKSYRHTHWVGVDSHDPGNIGIFDINCTAWTTLDGWATILIPWLLKECEPDANGKWHLTHAIEIKM